MLLYKNGMSLMYGMSTMVLLVLGFDGFPEVIRFLCFPDIRLFYFRAGLVLESVVFRLHIIFFPVTLSFIFRKVQSK